MACCEGSWHSLDLNPRAPAHSYIRILSANRAWHHCPKGHKELTTARGASEQHTQRLVTQDGGPKKPRWRGRGALSGPVQLTLQVPGLALLCYSAAPLEKWGGDPCLLPGWTQTLCGRHLKSGPRERRLRVRAAGPGEDPSLRQPPSGPVALTSDTPRDNPGQA